MDFDVITTPTAPRSVGPYSQGTRVGDLVFCSGQAAFDPATGRLVDGGIEVQTRQTLRNVEAVLLAAGSDLTRVVKVTVFLHDWKYFQGMNDVFGEFFARDAPARSTICGPRWPEGSLIAIEAVAVAKT